MSVGTVWLKPENVGSGSTIANVLRLKLTESGPLLAPTGDVFAEMVPLTPPPLGALDATDIMTVSPAVIPLVLLKLTY